MHFGKKICNFEIRGVDSLEKLCISCVSIGVQQQLDSTTAGGNGERGKGKEIKETGLKKTLCTPA